MHIYHKLYILPYLNQKEKPLTDFMHLYIY